MMNSLISKKEYLKNKAYKPSHVLNLRPERAGSVDHRLAEGNFFHSNESRRSLNIAADAKSLHKNRMQMFKNAVLDDSYEPLLTTKVVSKSLAPEVDLPSLKQAYKNVLGRSNKKDSPLNIITQMPKPKFQAYVTQETEKGIF